MPELPEVETVVRGLNAQVRGLTINRVLHVAAHLRRREPHLRDLAGDRFLDFHRRGKYIIARLHSGRNLLIHLRMTGRVLFETRTARRGKHDHLELEFVSATEHLVFHDTRKFGVVEFLDEKRHDGYSSLGIEATEITGRQLHELLRGRARPIKALLLDQSAVAGVGNIYADEALYRCRIHPLRPAGKLSRPQADALATAIRRLMRLAIKKMGTTFDSYSGVNGNPGEFARYLQVYNWEGGRCRRCRGIIKKMRAAGRGTHYCPKCQKR